MAGEDCTVGGEMETIGANASLAEARCALAWWLQAGVDCAIQEEPRNWLKPRPSPRTVFREGPSLPEPAPNVTRPSHETLSQLQEWLASSANLPLASSTARRILPHGPENAAIMLLSDSPSLEDYTAGQPIGGDAWALMERMLAAIGLQPDQAYSASLSPIHSPGARLGDRDREDYAEIARRHVGLVKPQRLLLLGDGPSRALLGKRLIDARGHVHKVEGVRTVVTFHPRTLINRPLDKSSAWRDLQLLMEDQS
jgi:uracil-DNA glycosylase